MNDIGSSNWIISKEMLNIKHSLKWDFCPIPFKDESFLSWFSRLAKDNCSDTVRLYVKLMNSKEDKINLNIILQDHNIFSDLISKLKTYISIPKEFTSHSLVIEPSRWDYLNIPDIMIKFCPYCLISNDTPYFRDIWQHRGINVCAKHKCLLSQKCQYCDSEIKYWETKFNYKITSCYNCKNEITDQLIQNRIKKSNMAYHKKVFDVYRNGYYNTENINLTKREFFQKLWKIIIHNSSDKNLKLSETKESIPTNRIAVAIIMAMRLPNFDNKLSKPFTCNRCDETFDSQDEFLIHYDNYDVHNIGRKELIKMRGNSINSYEVAFFRYNVVRHAISIGTTKDSVERIAMFLDLSASTVWNWIKRYRHHQNIECLIPMYQNSGRKRKFTKEFMRQITEGFVNDEVSSIKQIYKKLYEKLVRHGYQNELIPSYATFRRHLMASKESI